ncbi:MAG: RecX family transcriptional regulator [Piscirickettsiaceae bacterium]|nr:MAG: RecX family transcriptional regulator [Piscirickettsiaceae bacterium]
MLARREHSERELWQKLLAKGFEHAEIEITLDEFKEKNWQSDDRFAESYSRSRVHSGFGPVRIQYELKERGVDTSIDKVFDELPDWQQLLSELHAKKYGQLPPGDMKERAKRTRFFQHKGYTHDMIKRLFNEMS